MNKTKIHRFVITMITIAAIGLTIDSVSEHWEFWVNPLLIGGVLAIWVIHFGGYLPDKISEILYLLFGMFMALFHGVHITSFYDICTVTTLMLVLFSLYDSIIVLNLILAEYVLLMLTQFFFVIEPGTLDYDTITVSRLMLQLVIVVSIYFICRLTVDNRREQSALLEQRDEDIEKYDIDMEDFLSNISHELRTPVNVVNGMSDLLIKKKVGTEANSIKEAGIRLAYHIEDIQDYTECKRQNIILEEEDYMSTSLINDVVTSFRFLENSNDLELIVDLDPLVPSVMKGDIKKLHKIFRHLLENAVKFTKYGGIYVRMFAEPKEYGVNLCIEMTDTGIGMDIGSIRSISEGMYQANKKRNRSSGGIGLGLFIVYGFAHRMGGFVKIESTKRQGTTVRVTIPQMITDEKPCLSVSDSFSGDILFHVRSTKYKTPRVRDFYRYMASNLATGIHVPLYPAETTKEIERQLEKLDVRYIFMGKEEYDENPQFFDELSKGDIVVAVSSPVMFTPAAGSRVMVMPKPLYAYPIMKILNEGLDASNLDNSETTVKPLFPDVNVLVVDDEPMNLVVATGLFGEYKMNVDTAGSGKEAISKFTNNNYDIVFMDHMMPEMDGVEAMKLIKKTGEDLDKRACVVALTANAVSGAREMFIKEGFDGFLAKPLNTADFERVMMKVLPGHIVTSNNSEGDR